MYCMETIFSNNKQKSSGKSLRKARQKKRLIKHLHTQGPKSSSFLANKLNISIPTIQALLNELKEQGLVDEQGQGMSNGGRRPSMYGLADQSFFIMGMDIGRHNVRVAIYDHRNINITGTRVLNKKMENSLVFLHEVSGFARQLMDEYKIAPGKLIGVGVIMPGLIDARKGINYTQLNFEQPVARLLEDQLKTSVFIENDANAYALAELKYGIARGMNDILALHVDWGLGLGMILNGKLYRGSSGFSGEFSHIPVMDQGTLCNCGKQGCLETVASGMALVKRVKEGLAKGEESILLDQPRQDGQYPLEAIIAAANQGDQFTINLISELAQYLGKGIAALIQVLNPGLIILGGRVSMANEYLITPIQQALYLHCIPRLRENTEIVISGLQQDAGILGAIATVTEHVFE